MGSSSQLSSVRLISDCHISPSQPSELGQAKTSSVAGVDAVGARHTAHLVPEWLSSLKT